MALDAPPPAPVLDGRSADDVYRAALKAARTALPQWALAFGPEDDYFTPDDLGLVLFKLFGELFHKLSVPLDGVPDKMALAFWDTMGITLRAPVAAEAPMAFVPAVPRSVPVPAGTRVVSHAYPGVTFETADDLAVLPVSVEAAFTIRPEADSYADYSVRAGGRGAPFPPFADGAALTPLPHALYLSDPAFDFAGLSGRFSLTLEGANLYRHFFGRWFDAAGQALSPQFDQTEYDTLRLNFGDLPHLSQGMVDGTTGWWLGVAPAEGVRIVEFQQDVLPLIYSVAAQIILDTLAPDAALANDQQVDLKKGGRPFGQMPALQDAFYLASAAAFSKPGATVILNFELSPIQPPGSVTLAWEYWDGTGWRQFEVVDTTRNLTQSGTVTFTCPQIAATAVNNKTSTWLRIRIANGGYGSQAGLLVTKPADQVVDGVLGPFVLDKQAATAALKRQGIDFGYQYQPASFTPPFIMALTIDCSVVKRPERMTTCNGFQYAALARAPYTPPPEQEPTLYLGLHIDNFAAEVAGRPLTLFFAPAVGEGSAFLPAADGAPSVRLACLHPSGWQSLAPVAMRGDFLSEGIVVVELPAAMAPVRLFGHSLYWLRVLPPRDGSVSVPDLVGIFPNTVPAFNAQSHTDVVLGSSTGEPDQSFGFPQHPILEGVTIEIQEPTPILAGQMGAATGPAWVKWREVSNFTFSTPLSRHYVIDHSSGILTFGDGVRGMVPPQGRDNVRATAYRSGGGTGGNLPAGALSTLHKAMPAIQSVTNVLSAVGGVEADTVRDLTDRAPAEIRSQGRAVTCADFAGLAVAASQQVARAVCTDAEAGGIAIAVLPRAAGQTPMPDAGLISLVGDYLKARCLPLVADRITVGGPEYRPVAASFRIVLDSGVSLGTVSDSIRQAFAAYLHPLTGNQDGRGWDFGALVDTAAIAKLAQGVAGIAMVDGVSLDDGLSSVALGRTQLPMPGAVQVEVADADTV